MRSFLLEYTKREEEDVTSKTDKTENVDIHVNLWCMNSQKSEDTPRFFLDFGFMINDISNINHIILYCPFSVKRVEDLGKCLFKNNNLIEAIFNETCEVTGNIHPNRIKVIKKGDDFKSSQSSDGFIVYKLRESLIKISNNDGYGRIEITLGNILSGNESKVSSLSDKKYYFRIRITPSKDDIEILKRENEKINLLQDSSLRTTEIIDFRINDFRSIIDDLREEAFRLNTFNISSIHYLIMRDATDEFISGHNEYKSRVLEKKVWEEYISLNSGDIIAYHFKKVCDGDKFISSFTNLSRFKYPLNTKERIIWYVVVIIAMSVGANWLSSLLTKIF
ncbi:hypothetical protein [Rodentibacter haemolyticus]|uniref:Uncharacterized protein n=1 Tax=Rodentibacter haemolyticus TaxID=2778911 RepID=A0ABX6UV67_9PAST|nr:hypothetical protein [Rodentibacter haemolyticus]QPB41677.1 hypothetical protein IHV77_06935 [Rodentibacter haemolyticus]